MACAQFPQVDASVPAAAEAADFPDFVPLGPLMNTAMDDDTEATETEITARVAGLRVRAAALRNRSID